MRRLYWLITILLISFISYLIVLFLPRDYEINYKVDEYKVNEKYVKTLKYHQYLIAYQEKVYPLIIPDKYSIKRQNVEKIEEINNDTTNCLLVTIKETSYPICYVENQLTSFHFVNEDIKTNFPPIKEYSNDVTDKYDNIKIYNLLNNNYLIWNYKGYYYLNNKQKENIKLLKNDNYNNALAYQVDKYLITPNYDNEYFFKEYLVIDANKMELSSFTFDSSIEISYNSYYPGTYNKYLYLVDKKNKLEYKINVKKKTITIVGDKNNDGVWYDNEWKDISLNKLINNEYYFNEEAIHNYQLIDEQLYYIIGKYKILISKNNVKDIISIKGSRIYYLVKNTLYMYSDETGEIKLLEYNEWDFNYQNKIFIVE